MTIIDQASGKRWTLFEGDCMEVLRAMPDRSVDLSVSSPPYAALYTYSASERDLGNCASDEEFYEQYAYVVRELYRVMRPGRVACVDCKDLVDYAGSSETGMAGLRDFPGNLVRLYKAAGFSWHSRVTCWRNPVTEMQKTKAHGLLFKQLRADSTFSRMGLPMYVLMFRKWAPPDEAKRPSPLDRLASFEGVDDCGVVPVTHTAAEFPLEQWQRWASPVWMDIDYTDVLNVRAAREEKDEKHLAPMPLGIIERCIGLYSNPNDVVFDPFAGIGSVGYQALKMGRRFVGAELKESYWRQACANLHEAETVRQRDLFDAVAT